MCIRYRYLFVGIAAAALLLLALTLWDQGPLRSWRLVETKPLADGISMRVENLFLFPSGTNTFLRVRCRYLGSEPERLSLRAALLNASPPVGADQIPAWHVGIPDDGQGGVPGLWEFRINPVQKEKHLLLRIYWQRQSGDTSEHFVDFNVPYLPKMTHGEVDA